MIYCQWCERIVRSLPDAEGHDQHTGGVWFIPESEIIEGYIKPRIKEQEAQSGTLEESGKQAEAL